MTDGEPRSDAGETAAGPGPEAPAGSGEAAAPQAEAPGGPAPGVKKGWLKESLKVFLGSLRILFDPAGGLEATYSPGKPALIRGLAIGIGCGVLIPLVQLLSTKLTYGKGFSADWRDTFKQVLGGIVFLAAGTALSFLFRRTIAKAKSGNFVLDLYLFGSALIFPLAGAIAGGILFTLGEKFFDILARTIVLLGILFQAFAYDFGLVKVGGAEAKRSFWVAVLTLGGALLIGGLLNFDPSRALVPLVPNIQIPGIFLK